MDHCPQLKEARPQVTAICSYHLQVLHARPPPPSPGPGLRRRRRHPPRTRRSTPSSSAAWAARPTSRCRRSSIGTCSATRRRWTTATASCGFSSSRSSSTRPLRQPCSTRRVRCDSSLPEPFNFDLASIAWLWVRPLWHHYTMASTDQNRGGVWVRLQGLLCQLQVCSTSPPSPSAGGRHLLGSGGWSGPTYVGPNIIQVEVTAADGTVSNIYEVQVRPLILFWGETVGNVCEG
jgi:hypothetical protein